MKIPDEWHDDKKIDEDCWKCDLCVHINGGWSGLPDANDFYCGHDDVGVDYSLHRGKKCGLKKGVAYKCEYVEKSVDEHDERY